jgi:hypothetical protein
VTDLDIDSPLPVDGHKCEQIALSDAHDAVEPVRCEPADGNPAANRPG